MFNQYPTVSPEIVTKLSRVWLGSPWNYIYKDSSGNILKGILYELKPEDYQKASKRLTGDSGELQQGDRVYVLPNCRIPLYKLDDFIKECQAERVPDISRCTKIIGHDKVIEQVKTQAAGSSMLIHDSSVYQPDKVSYPQWWKEEDKEALEIKMKDMLSGIDNPYNTILSGVVVTNLDLRTYDFYDKWNKWFITPAGALVLYYSILNKAPVINENYIFEKIGKPVVLDQESYHTISEMLASADTNNHKVGSELLANSDIDKSLFWIWKLSRSYHWQVSNQSRFKNIRLFLRMSLWDQLTAMDEEMFMEYLYQKNLLTKEYFKELVYKAAEKYNSTLKSNLFSMSLTPSDKYKDFADDVIIKFNSSSEVEIYEDPEPV